MQKWRKLAAYAIGTSGRRVKSTLSMRDNLEELNTRGLADRVPVLLGGAALTRTYVERDLREIYDGRVFYGRDAFEGLHTMDRLMDLKRSGSLEADTSFGIELGGRDLPRRAPKPVVDPSSLPARSPSVATDNEI